MKKWFFLITIVCTTGSVFGQVSFEKRIKAISSHIDKIHREERENLKKEVESINERLDEKLITVAEADRLKQEAAEQSALSIENKVAPFEEEIQELIKQKAEGKMDSSKSKDYDDSNTETIEIKWKPRNKWKNKTSESRTTSQFVFAFGKNNLVTDGDLGSIDGSDFKFNSSRFYEWGFTGKTRIFQDLNLLHIKYGLSLIYNNLRPTDNRYFAEDGNQTFLATHPENLVKNPYFRNIQLVLPVHLEFDLTKKRSYEDKVIYRTQRSVRAGIGGYAGINLRTKQILDYRSNGNDVHQTTKGDFNTNSFIYGVGVYVGYKDISLYSKYDLNTLFRNNPIDQNNISIGLRFDFN